MLHRSFKPAKCKTALKLSVSRIKLLNNKREVQIKQIKRELAQLLESGQIQTARIRVEHVFREEKTLTAYNLIEIYCELIAARLPIIESQKNCPIDLKEAITSVIFATPRCSSDVPELADIKKHLTAKYGKDFVSGAIEMRPDCGVNRMLVEKLSAKAPDGPTKLKILTAIAEEHNVKWNPELFSDSDPKSAQDLLNGPNTFEMASKIHTEAPPPVPARPNHHDDRAPPNTQVPQRPNENFNEPNTRQSSGYQNFPSTGVRPNNATTSSSFHSEERSSGIGHEKMEPKQSYPRNNNSSSSSGQDWTMGFKDATSAAEAAAESAERASMAARAAAELSQRSAESPRSHGYSLKDERPKSYGYSPKDEPPKSHGYSPIDEQPKSYGYSPKDEAPKSHGYSPKDEPPKSHGYSPKDEPPKSYGYSSKDEPPKSYGYSPNDEPPMSYGYSPKAESPRNYASLKAPENNSFHGKNLGTRDEHIVRDEYSQKRSPRSHENEEFFEEVTKKNQDHMKKQSSNVSRRSHSHSSSFGDSQEKVPRRNSETTYFEETKPPSRVSSRSHSSGSGEIHEDIFRNKDPFAHGDIDSKENTALFDDYGSDNDHHKVDLLADSTVWSPKRNTDEKLAKSTSPFHPSVFSQAAEVSSPPTRPDDSPPAAFDDYDSPSSGSDEEPGKSGLQKLPSGKNVRSSEDSDRRSQGIKSVPVPEKKFESTVHVTEEEEDLYDFSKDSELLIETSSESGNKLKFGALTGGLRNKGITRPPYTKKPSFRAKEETENTRSDIGKSSSSSQSSTVRPSVDPRAGDEETRDERSSSRQSKKASMRSFVGRGDYSDDDDNIDELLQQDTKINRPSFNRRPVVEPNRKPSPKAKLADSDSDSSDSEEDVAPKSKSPINAHPRPTFSRRTKASSPMKTTVLSEETGGRSYSKPNPSDGAEPKSSSTGQAFSKMSVSPSYVAEPKSSSRTSDVNETLPKARGRSYSKPNPRDEAEPKSSLTGQAFSKIPVSPSHVPEPKTSSRSSHVNEALPKTSGRSYSKPNPSDRAEPKSSLTGQAFSKTTVSPSYVAEPKSSSRNSHVDEDLPRTTKGTNSGFDTGRAYSKINVSLREPVVTPGYRPESKSSSSTSCAGEALSKPRTEPESSDQPRFVKQDSPKPNPESRRSPRADSSKSSPKSTKSDASEASKVMSRENSSKDDASHVHPKLPDSDAFTAFFHSLRRPRE